MSYCNAARNFIINRCFMKRTELKKIFSDAAALNGEYVTVCGWAKTVRDSKSFGFIELNDGSYFKNCQIVFVRDELYNYEEIAGQNVGACLKVTGKVILTPERNQPFEIRAESVTVLGSSTPD